MTDREPKLTRKVDPATKGALHVRGRTAEQIAKSFDKWSRGLGALEIYRKYIEKNNYCAPDILAEKALPYLGPESQILDIGCGEGRAGEKFLIQGHTLSGVDLSQEMLQLALKNGYKEARQLDVGCSPLPWTSEFDVAISAGVLGQYLNTKFVLPLMVSALKPDGLIAITYERDSSALDKLLSYLGLEVLDHDFDERSSDCGDFVYLVARRVCPVK